MEVKEELPPPPAGGRRLTWNIGSQFFERNIKISSGTGFIPFGFTIDCPVRDSNVSTISFQRFMSKTDVFDLGFQEPWLIRCVIKFSKDEEDLLQVRVCVNNKKPKQDFNSEKLIDRELVFEVVFDRFEGIGLAPLVDYSKPTDYTDVVLVIDGVKFHQSKAVLSSHSDYFDRMFFGGFSEEKKEEVVLEDLSPDIFTSMLDSFYGSYLPTDENVEPVLDIADRFGVQSVSGQIQDYLIHYSPMKNLQKLELAEKYRLSVLKLYVLNVWKSSDFVGFTEDTWKDMSSTTTFALLQFARNN